MNEKIIIQFMWGFKTNLTRKDWVEDTEDHGLQVKQLQSDAAELWDAQPHKHVIGIKETAQYLVGEHS